MKKKRISAVEKDYDVKYVCKQLDKLLPSQAANFVKSQIKVNLLRSKQRMRWSLQDKLFALSVFYHSRKAYRILGKLFALPCKSTLIKLLADINVYAGFHNCVFQSLKQKLASFTSKDKQCILVFDEMAIKSGISYEKWYDVIEGMEDFGTMGKTKHLANTALVFMIKGISQKWKQCIGYFFSAGPISSLMLKQLAMEAIDKLSEVGLHVKVIVCDQGSNNRSFLQTHCKVSVEKPFFTHNDQKIYVVYDPPHLLKNIRNNLKKHNYIHDGQKIDWWDLVNFYNFDKAGPIRMAPKLTDDHFSLPMFTKMRVRLAAQVLSHSVAAGVSTLQRLGNLQDDAKFTAEFVELMDQLFNSFNSSSLKSRKTLGHAFNNDSGHTAFLEKTLDYFSHLSIPNNQSLPCIKGWMISIKSLLFLWSDLSENYGFSHLFTSCLNQDSVENLFSIIRGKGGHRFNPDAREFRAAYRQVLFDQMLMPSPGSNCELDTDKILLSLSSLTQENVAIENNQVSSDAAPPNLTASTVTLPVQNVEAYMAGYLLRKSEITKCSQCKLQCQYDEPPQSQLYVFLNEKSQSGFDSLYYPNETFVKLVEQWEGIFSQSIDEIIHMNGILARCIRIAEHSLVNFLLCQNKLCQLRLLGMLKLYMKVRLHSVLKRANKAMAKCKSGKKSRKLVKLQHL